MFRHCGTTKYFNNNRMRYKLEENVNTRAHPSVPCQGKVTENTDDSQPIDKRSIING